MDVSFFRGRTPPIGETMLTTFQRMGALSLVVCGLVGGFASLAQGGNKSAMAQSSPAGSSASPRAPVPFERKGPSSVPPGTPDTAPIPRRTASGPSESGEPTDLTPRGDLDRAAAKAAVEADGYKRMAIRPQRLMARQGLQGRLGDRSDCHCGRKRHDGINGETNDLGLSRRRGAEVVNHPASTAARAVYVSGPSAVSL